MAKSVIMVAMLLPLWCAVGLEGATITSFPLTDISNDSSGLWASATATVTSGPGYIDVLVQNTSPRQDNFQGSGLSANPFITELEINLGTYQTAEPISLSYVNSTATTLYTQGAGNAATVVGPAALYYKLVDADSQGMDKCLMFGEADNLRNDSAIASLSALDAMNVPVEDFATGFLNASPYADSGAVIDAALFHFALDTTETPDTSYWSADTLMVKFQGGGDYSWHVANVPEPTALAMLALGSLLLRRRR